MSESPNLLPSQEKPVSIKNISATSEKSLPKKTPEETPRKEITPDTAPRETIMPDEESSVSEKVSLINQELEEIEKRLTVGYITEAYNAMPPTLQQEFRVTGEQAARHVQKLLQSAKIPFHTIVTLVTNWLLRIPEHNRFFLMREALIRSRKVASLKKDITHTFGALLAQVDFFKSELGEYAPMNVKIDFLSQLQIIGLALAALIGSLVILYIIRFIIKSRHENRPELHESIVQITVPKEQQMKEKVGDMTIEQIRGQIASMEAVFAALGDLKAEKGFTKWLFGTREHFAFEIVARNGLINFYASIPHKYRFMVEQQLQAQFPSIQIEDTPDYNIFKPKDSAVAAYLSFEKTNAYPLKTYLQLETDPLNALLNPLSKLGETAQASIQYVCRSAHKKWRKTGKHYIKRIHEGKKDKKGFTHGLSETVKMATATEKKEKELYKVSPLEEQLIKSIDEKMSKAGFDVNIRLVASASTHEQATTVLKSMISGFSQFNLYQFGNGFKAAIPKRPDKILKDYIYRRFKEQQGIVINTQEFTSLWHLPLPTTEVPNIAWLQSRKAPPPQNTPTEGILLGYNLYRGVRTEVRMGLADRLRHVYAIGMTGTGKSTLLANMAAQGVKNGEGLCVMDPHGDLAHDVVGAVPPERIDDVIYFDPADTSRPMGLNMLEFDPQYPEQKTFVVNEMIEIFDKLYDLKATGGPIFEQYMRNAMLLIMSHPESGSTLMEISKVLVDEDFRRFKLSKCDNPVVTDFWTKEAEKAGGEAALANMVPYITSKLNQFIANDIMRPIIGQQESAFNFRKVMDEGKILLINLSKGRLGDMNSQLLGMIIIGKLLMCALSRTDIPEKERKPFFLYIDEFQNYLTDSIATILSEARKYKLSLNIAHQYIGQLVVNNNEKIKNAVFGNVGTKVVFRIGTEDAEFLEKEYTPVFSTFDLLNIEAHNAYVKLLIDSTASRPFNMTTYPPIVYDEELANALKELTKLTYGRDRELVEEEIRARSLAAGE